MTDITELAQRVKTEASAIDDTQWYLAKPSEIRSLVEALEKSEKTSEARREAIDRTHNMFVRERDRANAAEEALEKAQAQSSKWLEAYHKAVSIGARYEERIAELESRTVKLPTTRIWAGVTEFYEKSDVIAVIRAAGVEVSDD